MAKEKDKFVIINGPDNVSDSVLNLYRITFDFFEEGVALGFTCCFVEGAAGSKRPAPGPGFSMTFEDIDDEEFLVALRKLAAKLGKQVLKGE